MVRDFAAMSADQRKFVGTKKHQFRIFFHIIRTDSIRSYYGSCIPIVVHRLQLSKSIRLVDWHARRYVLLPIQRILQIYI